MRKLAVTCWLTSLYWCSAFLYKAFEPCVYLGTVSRVCGDLPVMPIAMTVLALEVACAAALVSPRPALGAWGGLGLLGCFLILRLLRPEPLVSACGCHPLASDGRGGMLAVLAIGVGLHPLVLVFHAWSGAGRGEGEEGTGTEWNRAGGRNA